MISDLTLERIALGELPPDELADAQARLAAEEGGAERLDALRRSDAAILERYPAEQMVPRILLRLERAQGRSAWARGWWSGLGLGLAAAAAALLVSFLLPERAPRADTERPAPPLEDTRLKGLEPHLVVHRRVQDRAERLNEGDAVRRGDVLRLGYVGAGRRYGVLFSVDGAGSVTLHHPEFPSLPPELAGPGRVDLPFSYELDDAPGFERFVFVVGDAPIDVAAVLGAARALAARDDALRAPVDLPPGLEQSSLVLRKGDSR